LLVDIGTGGSLGLFPLARVLGSNIFFSLSRRFGFLRLPSIFVAGAGSTDAVCIGMFLR
jgi:hypothetical protein